MGAGASTGSLPSAVSADTYKALEGLPEAAKKELNDELIRLQAENDLLKVRLKSMTKAVTMDTANTELVNMRLKSIRKAMAIDTSETALMKTRLRSMSKAVASSAAEDGLMQTRLKSMRKSLTSEAAPTATPGVTVSVAASSEPAAVPA